MGDLDESLFLMKMTRDEFLKRYKMLLEDKARWPNGVSNAYYQDRQNISRDLRYFRLAFELMILTGVSPTKAIETVYLSRSTNDLDAEESQWSMVQYSDTMFKSSMPRDC